MKIRAAFHPPKFNEEQLTAILNRLVPMIADEDAQPFLRTVLTIMSEERSAAEFADFVNRLLIGVQNNDTTNDR